MIDEADFQRTIEASPKDWGPKLVFADWLEETGQCQRAAAIRERHYHADIPALSDEQKPTFEKIVEWFGFEAANRRRQTLTLGGYAGTGKTTIIRHLVDKFPNTAVAALAGKAAFVLRSKGVEEAGTIHKLIYDKATRNGQIRFTLKRWLDKRLTDRIIIDEASMVDQRLYDDLLSFELPILFVGDHGQLEPIGRDIGLLREPELKLTTIHRQALENPIIRLATAFRERRPTPYWKDRLGRLAPVPRGEFWNCLHLPATFICGFNATRHKVNKAIREKLGFKGRLPVPGDRLICVRNNARYEIFNGQMATCIKRRKRMIEMRMDDDRVIEAECAMQQFGKDLKPEARDRISQQMGLFDFGYCLTAHKSQGSEYDTVVVLEEIAQSWDAARWRYTTATRARDRLIYCR